MEITHIGHACEIIRFGDETLLLDPWFGIEIGDKLAPHPAFGRPDPAVLNRITGIHISHLHRDHFCPESLKHLNPATPVYLPRYEDGVFARRVRDLGFSSVIEIEPGPKGHKLGPISLHVFPTSGKPPYDSALILVHDQKSYLFDGDVRIGSLRYFMMKRLFPKFAMAFVGLMDIGLFPACYDFSQTNHLTAPISDDDLRHFEEFNSLKRLEMIFELLDPEKLILYASDLKFQAGLASFNQWWINSEIIRRSRIPLDRVVEPLPGEIVNLAPRGQLGRRSPPSALTRTQPQELLVLDALDQSQLENKFAAEFRRLARTWNQPMKIDISVSNSDRELCRFRFLTSESEVVQIPLAKLSWYPDLELNYDAQSAIQFLKGDWSLKQLNFTYRVRAKINHLILGQMNLQGWS